MDLFAWLAWLFQSGGSVMVASWILERIPSYVNLVSAEAKKYIFWAASFALSSLAFAAVNYVPRDVLELLAPYFGFAYGTFAAIFLGTVFHFFDKK